ncbi:MAG TPA: FecR domain-containing protein [Gemmatimonadaceae bacterium]|nr:FecR domain-containing protein [Gemmatimonadaceae bacterium]
MPAPPSHEPPSRDLHQAGGAPEWEALARYLADEAPVEEVEGVRRWLAAHPEDAALVRALDETLDRLAVTPAAEIDVEAALARARARRDGDAPLPRLHRPSPDGAGRAAEPRPVPHWRAPALRAAAVIAVASAAALAWWSARRGDEAPALAQARVYETGVGERDSLRLPDGSLAVLGPRSRLVVAADYAAPAREVELRGEAYFEVRHDDAHAFTVRAGAAAVRDVGTAFTVRNDDDSVRVAVREGAVLLHAAAGWSDDGVVLHQGDVGVLEAGGQAVARRGALRDDAMAWTRGQLVFRDASLAEVAAELRRWYGLELRVEDSSLAGRHLTASFAGEPAERVLDVIGLALGAELERRGDTVVVRAAGTAGR